MQTLPVTPRRHRCRFPGPCQHVKRSSIRIDDRCGSNSNFRGDKGAFDVILRNSRDAFAEKVYPPERYSGLAVGVEGVYAVVLGRNQQYIVPTLAWYLQACEEERLRIDVSVHFQREYLSKMVNVHIARSQDGFEPVGAAAHIVILRRGHTLRACAQPHHQNKCEGL